MFGIFRLDKSNSTLPCVLGYTLGHDGLSASLYGRGYYCGDRVGDLRLSEGPAAAGGSEEAGLFQELGVSAGQRLWHGRAFRHVRLPEGGGPPICLQYSSGAG